MEPVTWYLTGVDRHSKKSRAEHRDKATGFVSNLDRTRANLPTNALLMSMNQLSNHDCSRFLTRTSGRLGSGLDVGVKAANEGVNKGIFKEAVLVQFTWMGAPTIYYGDEVGVRGWADPDNRRPYPWAELGGKPDTELLAFHKAVIALHKRFSCIKTGSTVHLYADEAEPVYAFGRWDSTSAIVVAINNSDEAQTISLPVWKIGLVDGAPLQQVLSFDQPSFTLDVIAAPIEGGMVEVTLPPFGGVMLGTE